MSYASHEWIKDVHIHYFNRPQVPEKSPQFTPSLKHISPEIQKGKSKLLWHMLHMSGLNLLIGSIYKLP
jgi:hypothetical protein